MLEMWGDQEDKVTPKYLNSVTNSRGEPVRQRWKQINKYNTPIKQKHILRFRRIQREEISGKPQEYRIKITLESRKVQFIIKWMKDKNVISI